MSDLSGVLEYISSGTIDISGSTLDLSGTIVTPPLPPPPPTTISLEDLINEQTILLQKEAADEEAINAIFYQTLEQLRMKLLDWARNGLPDMFAIASVSVTPPYLCSDGKARNFIDYVEYVTNTTLPILLTRLQDKLTNINVVFSHSFNTLTVYVKKP